MLELIYTASPKGLDPSRSGFVTVARTEGFPPNLISPLENLSGYKALYSPDDPSADKNPANYSYQRYGQGSGIWYVISRITYAGLSYTGRSNNLAHHLLLSRDEISGIPGGAAAILADDRNFPAYEAPPHLLGLRRCRGKSEKSELQNGASWARLCGNADWARVIAERFRGDRAKGVVLQFTPGLHQAKDILDLVSDVVELLTPEETVDFTFSTYCYQSTIGNPIFLRAYTADSPFLASIRRMHNQNILVLGEENPLDEVDQAFLRKYQERLAFEYAKKTSNEASRQLAIVHANANSGVEIAKPLGNAGISSDRHESRPSGRHSIRFVGSSGPASSSDDRGLRFFILLGVAVMLSVMGLLAVLFGPRFFSVKPVEPTAPEVSQATEQTVGFQEVAQPEVPETASSEVVLPVKKEPIVDEVPLVVPLPEKMDENLCFYEGFLLFGERSIPLPAKYAKGGVLSVELSGIGDKNALQNFEGKLSRSEVNSCVVFPLKLDASGISERLIVEATDNASQLILEIRDGKLLIQEPPVGELVPRRENISRIFIDGQMLYEQEFSDELLTEFVRTEKIVGKVEYIPDGRLVGRVSDGTERLGKYQEQLRLVANVLNGEKQTIREIPVELRKDGIEFTIENFGEVSEINRNCQKRLQAETELGKLGEKQKQCYRDLQSKYQSLRGRISRVESILFYFTNKDVKVQDGKKTRDESIELGDRAAAIRQCLQAFDEHYQVLKNSKWITQELFNEELVGLADVCQQLAWDMNNLCMAVPRSGENYLMDVDNIQKVLTELGAIGKLVNDSFAERLSIDEGIGGWQAELQKSDAILAHDRPRVAQKLRNLLPESAYVQYFKAPLEEDVVEIDVERLREELLKACFVEYRFVKK